MPLPTTTIALAGSIAISSLASPVVAQELSGEKIKRLLTGERVYLSTPFGVEVPLNYRAGGKVTGDVSGVSAASMFAPKETGRWWVQNDRLCQKWPTWYKGRQFCYKITQTGENTIRWLRNDGKSGTARIGG